MESIDQHLEEIGRMGQILNVDRHHREPILGMVAQVVHDAGLAGSSRRREHHMAGAQRVPQLRQKRLAESQIDRIDGCAGVEIGSVFHFHVDLVVNHFCRRNYYTTILVYVNHVVEIYATPFPGRDAAGGAAGIETRPTSERDGA